VVLTPCCGFIFLILVEFLLKKVENKKNGRSDGGSGDRVGLLGEEAAAGYLFGSRRMTNRRTLTSCLCQNWGRLNQNGLTPSGAPMKSRKLWYWSKIIRRPLNFPFIFCGEERVFYLFINQKQRLQNFPGNLRVQVGTKNKNTNFKDGH
jgi:hypothetical protein